MDREELKRLAQSQARKINKQSKIFLLKNKGRLLALGLLAAFFLILSLVYRFLAFLFSDLGATVICIASFILLIRFIAVASTFPGAFWFYHRQVQVEFNRDYCSRLFLASDKLLKCLQTDLDAAALKESKKYRLRFSKINNLVSAVYMVKLLLTEHIHVFKRMAECDKITAVQTKLVRAMEDLRR